MDDIVPGLLELLKLAFTEKAGNSPVVRQMLDKLKEKKTTYLDANTFAIEIGQILSDVYKENLSEERLPDGRMYYNIAKRILQPTLERNYNLVSDYCVSTQESLNRQAGLGIAAQRPKLNQSMIDGLIEKVSSADHFDTVKWVLDAPVRNFTQHVVDESVKKNAEFQYKTGLRPRIVRTSSGHCCDWCEEVAGVYDYPKVSKDVYRRHSNCRCMVDYHPGDGKKQNVWSKKWVDVDEGKSERVEIYSEEERRRIEKESLERVKRKFLSEYDIDIDDGILELNSEVALQAFDGIESMFKLYPDLKDRITDIGISSHGVMNCSGNKINFNPAYFSDNKKLQEVCSEMSEIGWWPKNSSPASIAVHEMGHAVNWNLIIKNPSYEYDFECVLDWNDQTTAKKIVSEACKKTKKTEFGKGKKNVELRNSQSQYGATKPAEAIAEAFADLYANKHNANPLSKAIVDEINRLFSEYEKGGK